MRYIIIVVAILMLAGVHQAAAQQFNTTQPIAGRTSNLWTFLTAWNLATEGFEASSSWYNGRNVWTHAAAQHQQWIARFVYDTASSRTRELAWYYSQVHVQ